jgi:hypothetical protein
MLSAYKFNHTKKIYSKLILLALCSMGLSGCLYEAPKYSSDKPLLNDPQPILSKSAKGYWLGMPNLINSTSRLNFNSELFRPS